VTAQPFVPDWAVPPGRFLAAVLAERGLTEQQLAEAAGLVVELVHALVKGSIPFDSFLAARIGHGLGTGPEFWLNAEETYRADLDRLNREWPYNGPEGRARLTGNLGTES
jgi:plasmid maintenance system antidote protein VapI